MMLHCILRVHTWLHDVTLYLGPCYIIVKERRSLRVHCVNGAWGDEDRARGSARCHCVAK